ncbi:hypothetical protein SERLADRAFT_432259 [Serpula lacrymans var. lacrymans S7.9]|uniref:Uncharacterized protein n=1 Tax=Serpula lacrymans var. lacrymans (strain S7.9) TaxID=578457 RepID=F8NEM8_SERL9|nr:uncharacterized protein SERLADRAFT_432259 [Serpula lacrymans var. lacrymans S7.9]EGO30662.1 hypothetical protein SERLADRAFT_432259 [Serpula lacrymans var. lacrymans S7.9]
MSSAPGTTIAKMAQLHAQMAEAKCQLKAEQKRAEEEAKQAVEAQRVKEEKQWVEREEEKAEKEGEKTKANMCLDCTPESEVFASCLDVGGRREIAGDWTIELPANMLMPENTIDSLVNATYPGIANGDQVDHYFLHRTILSAQNDAVSDLNSAILTKFPGKELVVLSIDKVYLALLKCTSNLKLDVRLCSSAILIP